MNRAVTLTKMTWTDHFEGWLEAHGKPGPTAHNRLQAARKRVSLNTSDDWQWLSNALGNPDQRLFVAMVFRYQPLPKRLLAAFLHAAVLERSPSRNRFYIEPCVRSWGIGEVNRRLLHFLQEGSNAEKAGAASAFYWVHGNPRNENVSELRAKIRCALLHEFVQNSDLAVRQRIVPLLRLDPSLYPPSDQPLIDQAIEVARFHPDEYIRHRIEIQLGGDGPFKPIPTT